MKVDNVISLGYNCEVSYRIRDYFGKLNSTIYSWAYIENRNDLIRSLQDPVKLAVSEKELLPWGMFRSKEYGITFHPKYSQAELFNSDGSENADIVQLAKDEMISRYTYLANKLNGFFKNENETTLYVCKMHPWMTNEEENISFIKELHQMISDLCVNENYILLVVLQKKEMTREIKSIELHNLLIRSVEAFAPDSDTEFGGDIAGWNKIFEEFELIW